MLCHRRFGKTVCAINELIKACFTCEKDNSRFAYVAPDYRQAKRIAWDYLLHFTADIPGCSYNISELRCDFLNGSRITLYGAENASSIRGIYLDGVVLDEYGDMSPMVFSQVIRPALSDRKGWALFIGTAKGGSIFEELYNTVKGNEDWYVKVWKASETGIIDPEELNDARSIMTHDEFEQEYECSWLAAIKGAYYANEMAELDRDKRFETPLYRSELPVETYWDLGVGDSTSIWFAQRVSGKIALVDYYENNGEGLQHYAKILQEKKYIYSKHVAPHDIAVRELGSGLTRIETAANYGIKFDIAPKIGVQDGINSARMLLKRCWFDPDTCKDGLLALRNYRKEYNEKGRTFRSKPVHDWSSHAADAFRYLAVSWKDEKIKSSKPKKMRLNIA